MQTIKYDQKYYEHIFSILPDFFAIFFSLAWYFIIQTS